MDHNLELFTPGVERKTWILVFQEKKILYLYKSFKHFITKDKDLQFLQPGMSHQSLQWQMGRGEGASATLAVFSSLPFFPGPG